MKFEHIHSIVGGVPYISEENARYLYDLIIREQLTDVLELGFAHGTATCYMAAALHEIGRGAITSVDLIGTKDIFNPSIEEQLNQSGLSGFVKVIRMQTGYTWFLHDEICRNTKGDVCDEVYDLCIIDGPKNWTIDGAAFFLSDKLLRKNGWIIFDDYLWTYDAANGRRESTDGITHRSLSKEERETPHIREIFELLVKQHPNYGEFIRIEGADWVLAKKDATASKRYIITTHKTIRHAVIDALRLVLRFFKDLKRI